jgi:hypothetical protein
MGVDTIGYLKGNVSASAICEYLSKKYGNVHSSMKDESMSKGDYMKVFYEKGDTMPSTRSGHINSYTFGIFYIYNNYNAFESLDYYIKKGFTESQKMTKSQHTTLLMGFTDKSPAIMKDLVQHFGGWYDENDCDESDMLYFEGTANVKNNIYRKYPGVYDIISKAVKSVDASKDIDTDKVTDKLYDDILNELGIGDF